MEDREPDEAPLDPETLRHRELEKEYWRTSEIERPGANSLHNLLNKAEDAAIFFDLVERYRADFAKARTVLEIGAGQGWASCIVKRLFPDAIVTVSDLSADAVASVPEWQRVYGVEVDRVRDYPSDALDEPDSSFDLVFCFAAAHHFGRHRRTLEELRRVLRAGGTSLYLYEPSCPSWMHSLAVARVKRKQFVVTPEDVLMHDRIRELAAETGLECEVDFFPSIMRRGPVETVYYALLGRVRPLQRILPCTANFRFRKRD
jgi:SAM-dependent methyltransferase